MSLYIGLIRPCQLFSEQLNPRCKYGVKQKWFLYHLSFILMILSLVLSKCINGISEVCAKLIIEDSCVLTKVLINLRHALLEVFVSALYFFELLFLLDHHLFGHQSMLLQGLVNRMVFNLGKKRINIYINWVFRIRGWDVKRLVRVPPKMCNATLIIDNHFIYLFEMF